MEVLFPIGVEMMSNTVRKIESLLGEVKAEPQNVLAATWEPSFERQRLTQQELIRIG